MATAPQTPAPVPRSPIHHAGGWLEELAQRLRLATDGKAAAEIAKRTGTRMAAVKRYLSGTQPSPRFIAKFAAG